MNRSASRIVAIATIGLALFPPGPAGAATPTISLHWQTCDSHVLSRAMGEGPVDRIVVTVTGGSGVIQALDVRLHIGNEAVVLAPAWRFDPAGCEAGHLQILPSSSDSSCPVLFGSHPIDLSGYSYFQDTSLGAVEYLARFDPFVADSTRTYTLVQFAFDHSNAIAGFGITPEACGCLDRPQCIRLANAQYLDGAGEVRDFVFGGDYLLWNDPTNQTHCPGVADCFPPCDLKMDSTCVVSPPTPAHARTWGSIKAVYRN